MPQILGQVVIPHQDQLAHDAVVNTFNFTGVDDVEDMCTAAYGRLQEFYEDAPGGSTNGLIRFMSTELNYPGARLKFYNQDDPEPRVPIFDESMGLVQTSPVGSTNLPGEVAVCTSYSAAAESGTNPRRRRGRLYIGPLNIGASTATNGVAARPSGPFITCLEGTTQRLAEASTLGCAWAVYSRRGSSFAIIEKGYVDNAFDTQRRRGVNPTTRTPWEVETPVG